MVSADDKKFIEDHRGYYDTLKTGDYMRGLSGESRRRMQSIIRAYWQPEYVTDLWCPPCVCDMVRLLYGQYEKWKAAQQDDPRIILIKANFPSHKPDGDV